MFYLSNPQSINLLGLKVMAWGICYSSRDVGYVLAINPETLDRTYNVIFKGEDEGMFESIEEIKDFLKSLPDE